MKKEDLIILAPTLLLLGAFLGAQIDDMFEPPKTTTAKPESEWPLFKIVVYGAGAVLLLTQGRKLVEAATNG